MSQTTATGELPDDLLDRERPGAESRLGLVLVWSREEPQRVGEVALLPPRRGGTSVLGRASEGERRVAFLRQRPGLNEPTGELQAPRISREHLFLRVDGDRLGLRSVGRLDVSVNGVVCAEAGLAPGDLVEIDREAMFLVTRRPAVLPGARAAAHPFGRADDDGVVGESPTAWELRQRLAFCAGGRDHVLVRGPSGAGKELVAQAIARRSAPGRPLVSRNAATFPEGLIDAELFGNLKDYPNPGMIARPGVVGEADGGTLFLDEIGEISHAMQAHLLRVLDKGEYQRLGESRIRVSRLRLIGATNRPLETLKHDLLARLTLRVEVPGLDERREDVPLVAAHLLERIAQEGGGMIDGEPPTPHPRLVRLLLTHPYRTHVREVHRLLLAALEAWSAAGGGRWLDAPPDLEPPAEAPRPAPPETPPDREAILQAYRRAGGVQTRVLELLALRDRFQLLRLEKKHGITAEDRERALARSTAPPSGEP